LLGKADDVIAALDACALFAGTDAAIKQEVAASGKPWEARPGEMLIRQGDHGDGCFIVIEGTATVAVDGVSIGAIGPGDCAGEMALLDDAPRSATVTADGPMELLRIGSDDFAALLERSPMLSERLTRALVRRLRTADTGWGQVAGDPEVLLAALLDLQSSPDPAMAERARSQAALLVQHAAQAAADAADDPLASLTAAERRVCDQLAEGLSNAAIAERLYISRHTVETHLKRIYAKLHIGSRVQLAALVLRGR
jgi:CRP-like cAMP-binding protein